MLSIIWNVSGTVPLRFSASTRSSHSRASIHHRIYATRNEAKRDLFAWIDGWDNTHRLHSALGYRSLAAMERMAA